MIEIGSYVSRNSYNNDMIFRVINRVNDTLYLKGISYRLYADANVSDCVLVDKENINDDFEPILNEERHSSNYFFLPGKILHLDGDREYLNRCMIYYKKNNVFAVGKKIDEETLSSEIVDLLKETKPNILVITGHDYLKKNANKKDINSYQNSKNFVNSVKQARKYEHDANKLIIISGACQSNYEALIKAGSNFASSPKRVNIHALDPAIIACNLAFLEKNKEVNLLELLEKTKNGSDGIGGVITTGTMYVGYPKCA